MNELLENEKLITFVVKKYYPNMVGDEDVIQNGRIGLYKASLNYDPEKGNFSTFAIKFIRNEVGNELSKNIRRSRLEAFSLDEPIQDEEETTTMGDCIGKCEETFDDILCQMTLNKFTNKLSPNDREFLNFKINHPYATCGELAEHFGITTNAVHIKNSRLKAKFKQFMEE